jgi:hypothetical protein
VFWKEPIRASAILDDYEDEDDGDGQGWLEINGVFDSIHVSSEGGKSTKTLLGRGGGEEKW